MRILVLSQVVPYPPDSGPKVKTYHLLRYLSARHEVHLVTFVRSATEEAHTEALREFCRGVTTVPLRRSRLYDVVHLARSLVTMRPFLIERDRIPGMHAAIDRLINQVSFDAVHADQLSMGQFAVDLPIPLRVLDEHNAVWTIVRRAADRAAWFQRPLVWLEWRKLRAYEGELCKRFDCVTVVSNQDRVALETAAGSEFRSATIPIAVDTEALAFMPRGSDAQHVVSVATMFYPPNVDGVLWFAERVFPLVRKARPETKFYIVGSRPPERVSRLAGGASGIVVTGYLPDLDPILRQSALLVVPVHSGSGMRVKILEAFARGLPVISTSIGVEGIPACPGEHLLVADEPHEFAQAIVGLLAAPDEARRLAGAARALVQAQYDWRTALQGLDDVYSHSVSRTRAPAVRFVASGV